ncbi:MAG: SAM-dependent methyltransferase [Chthoniobacterales bacterium]|nr:SAM-dependent methyltransferase [Chthoniobacterales bacterium]
MSPGEPALVALILNQIRRAGPISFRWFMEQALYHAEHGYYSSGRAVIGRRGDYFTNVSVGPLFGRMMAAQFREMWAALGQPTDFAIVEQGAQNGDFAGDVLRTIRGSMPDFFAALRYVIIEPFLILRARQVEALAAFGEIVSWRESIELMEPFEGLHFSNELFDALPVHLLSRGASESDWTEKCVTEEAERFRFVSQPSSDPRLASRAQQIPIPPGVAYETEVNMAAPKLVAAVAEKLVRGWLFIVDYGYTREDFYSPARSDGTVQSFLRHRKLPSPLLEVGRADITAHVEWTTLADEALGCGLQLAGFTDQHHFMTGLAAGPMRAEVESAGATGATRALQTLLHPTLLGRTFQYLAFARGVSPAAELSGFSFAQEPKTALGFAAR